MKKIMNQHGDVLLESIESVPVGAKQVMVTDGYVFEHGEGVHTHVFEDVSGIEVYEKNGETYVKVSKETHINHEEHGLEKIIPGVYKKNLERYWDYESEEAKKTID